jgi:hypothetical protein
MLCIQLLLSHLALLDIIEFRDFSQHTVIKTASNTTT